MKAWLQQNWKSLLAAVAVFLVVVLLYLYTRSRGSGAARTISFPGSSGSGSPGDGSSGPNPITQAEQAFAGIIRSPGAVPNWDPQHTGIPFWTGIGAGNIMDYIPWGAQVQIIGTSQGPPDAASGTTTWYQVVWGGVTGWINAFDLASFLGSPPAGFGAPGGPPSGPPFLPPAQPVPLPVPGSTPPSSSTALGGGPVSWSSRLRTAAVNIEGRSHRTALANPRRARQLAHDARQAVTESRRVFVESRGMAPMRRSPRA